MDRIQKADVNNKSSVVALAIKGNKKSKYVVQWALNKFVPEGMIFFKFIHVHAGIIGVPTPMGNVLPVSQVSNDVAAAYKKEVEWQTNQMLLPFKKMCEQRKVHVDVVVIESDDVATAVAEEVAKDATTKLVVGASSGGIFKRKSMASKVPQLQSKVSQASAAVANHGASYYKVLLGQNKHYIQDPPTVEKCQSLAKQLLYTRLASIPHRYNSFWKELEYAKSLMKNRQDLNLENVGIGALFGLECFAWFCGGQIMGRGFTFTGYYV